MVGRVVQVLCAAFSALVWARLTRASKRQPLAGCTRVLRVECKLSTLFLTLSRTDAQLELFSKGRCARSQLSLNVAHDCEHT